MIESLIWLLGYQLAGELVSRACGLPIPGAVLGMLFLFITLCWRRGTPAVLASHVPAFLKHLSLLFIPAGAAVLAYRDLLTGHALAIAFVLVASTLVTLLVPAAVLRLALRLRSERRG
ncbi:CidA/LrgA family protein [Gulbenkiania mobilis]|uniref:Holin-like protein n=1 Tax=Gulbenkiania mobilis TaxID=397457 RepID=A0ABY2CXZ2_GULMO|nr:CidA/LrgA family protein [Gulbenkiania mobilis]TCW32290.1 holin-like protein [Gulbenkiania mobilis]